MAIPRIDLDCLTFGFALIHGIFLCMRICFVPELAAIDKKNQTNERQSPYSFNQKKDIYRSASCELEIVNGLRQNLWFN